MKIEELKNAPQWLLDAKTRDADVEIINGVVHWHDGVWYDGEWHGGTWHDGVWHDGVWYNGMWHGGTWHDGEWHGGRYYATWLRKSNHSLN